MNNPLRHYFSFANESWAKYWDLPAFTDYDGKTHYNYSDLVRQMVRLQLLFEGLGIQKGDKVAFCSGNMANWAVSFLAVESYGAVGVCILPDFTGPDIEKLVNHSEAKFVFAGPTVEKKINAENMPDVQAILSTKDFSAIYLRDKEAEKVWQNLDQAWTERYPNGFQKEDIHFVDDNLDDLALINYTSGTTSAPKGVMLTWRALSSNAQFGSEKIPCGPGDTLVNMLPLAHVFGMMFEFMYPCLNGVHIYFITRMTTPVLMKAFAECKPYLILTVPLVLEKIYKKKLAPTVNKPLIKVLWNIPGIGRIIRNKVRDGLMSAFGGNIKMFIVGGAALSSEVEKCLMDVRFPITVGYGMTESAPLLAYTPWQTFHAHSCGRNIDRMQVRIDSENPATIVGEIQAKGDNLCIGYYKNEEATRNLFTEDGWLRTGDLGVIDKEGNIFIKGRSKNMLLSANGQNIYPEEIEDVLNSLPGVAESVVVSRDTKLVALVFPDAEYKPEDGKTLDEVMADNRVALNRQMPNYSQVTAIELVAEEFEKTPKRSIKRFMYK